MRPRPCENHFACHRRARLIQAVLLRRIKDSPRPHPRFFCCALTRSSGVFTQPGPRSSHSTTTASIDRCVETRHSQWCLDGERQCRQILTRTAVALLCRRGVLIQPAGASGSRYLCCFFKRCAERLHRLNLPRLADCLDIAGNLAHSNGPNIGGDPG
jgi:hypothetical protein